jgi:hypothetical protein
MPVGRSHRAILLAGATIGQSAADGDHEKAVTHAVGDGLQVVRGVPCRRSLALRSLVSV